MILYTSALDAKRRRVLRYAAGNLGCAAFCGFFAAVYEHFSFGVYADAMLFSFAPPLAAGLLLVLLALGRRAPSAASQNLLTAAAVTMAVGMLVTGVLEIYGTAHRLTVLYPIAAAILLVLSALLHRTRGEEPAQS